MAAVGFSGLGKEWGAGKGKRTGKWILKFFLFNPSKALKYQVVLVRFRQEPIRAD
jgi:hypothetical protein